MIGAIRALSILSMSTLMGAIIAFSTQTLIARMLGPHDFGIFSGVLTVIALMSPLCGFGVAQFWLKAFGEEGWNAIRWLKPSFYLVVMLTIIISMALVSWGIIGAENYAEQVFYGCLSFFLWGQVAIELLSGKFQLEENYLSLGLSQFAPHFLRFLFILIVFSIVPPAAHLVAIGLSYTICALVLVVIYFPHFRKMLGRDIALVGHGTQAIVFKSDPDVRSLARNSLPFALAAIFHLLYFQGSIFFLLYLDSPEAAGLYNVAFVIMSAIYLIPAIVYQKYLLPKIHRWANYNPALFYKSYRIGSLVMFAVGAGASILIWLASDYFFPLIFGGEYVEAIWILKWLSISAPLRFMATSVGAVLLTHAHMYKKVFFMGCVAFLSFLLNIMLIPYFSVQGAVASAIVSEVFLLGLYCYAAKRYVFRR